MHRRDTAAFVVPRPEQINDDDLSQTVGKVMSRVGAVAEAVSDAPMDGKLTTAETDLIEREFQDA